MKHRPYRTLLLWIIWVLAATGVYFGFYQDAGLWNFLSHDKTRITWIILAFFIFGLASSLALSIALTKESLAARQIEEDVRDKGLIGFETTSESRAVARYFQSLKLAMDSNSKPDAEALLNVELAVFQRMSRSIEVTGNLVLSWGSP